MVWDFLAIVAFGTEGMIRPRRDWGMFLSPRLAFLLGFFSNLNLFFVFKRPLKSPKT